MQKSFFLFDLVFVWVFPVRQEWSSSWDANITFALTEIKLQTLTCFHREQQDSTPPVMGSLSPFLSLHYSYAALSSSSSMQVEVAAYYEEEKQT